MRLSYQFLVQTWASSPMSTGCMCLPLRNPQHFWIQFWGSDLYSWINWRPKWAVSTTVIPHKYVCLTPLDFGSWPWINEWTLLYYSSPSTGAQSGDHYCWRYSGCSIQGPWHVESCSSVGNYGSGPGGFVLRGLWGQRGASPREHLLSMRYIRDGECRISYVYAYLALDYCVFPSMNKRRCILGVVCVYWGVLILLVLEVTSWACPFKPLSAA